MRTLACRLLLPLLLLATAAHWHHHGLDSFPAWIGNLARMLGWDELAAARLMAGTMIATAAVLVLLGARRRFGVICCRGIAVAYAFGAIAVIASIMAAPARIPGLAPLALPVVGLGVALAVYALLGRVVAAGESPARVGGAWRAMLALLIGAGGVALGARLDFAPRSTNTSGSPQSESILLDYVQWQGRTLPDTGLSRLIPILTPRTLEGRSIIILYNPECSHCREVFEQYLAEPVAETRVIAIEIPPNPGTLALSGDDLGEMPCANCERLKLPEGRQYIIKPPTVLVVVDGRVVCATDSDFKACLGNSTRLPTPASSDRAP